MLTFLLRRVISGLIVLFLFLTVVFFAVQLIIPGDYASRFALSLSPSQMEELRTLMALDQPLLTRYFTWLGNLLRGNLGHSYGFFNLGPPVTEILEDVLPPTLLVFGIGTALAFLIGQSLGKFVAWRGPGPLSGTTILGATLLYTSFPPWIAFLGSYLFITRLNIFTIDFDRELWMGVSTKPAQVMTVMLVFFAIHCLNLILINSLLKRIGRANLPTWLSTVILLSVWIMSWWLVGYWDYALDILRVAFVPFVVYVLISFGETVLIMRTTMSDTMHEEYITTARAKGLSEASVRDRHAARTAILPVISRLIVRLPYLLTGVVMVEFALNWSGIGSALFNAVAFQNITLVMGIALVIGIISMLSRLGLDVLQLILDPRIRSAPQSLGSLFAS